MTTFLTDTPALSADKTEAPKPPVAKVVAKDVTVHGDTRIDNYFWLRDKQNPEVAAYLNAENVYADAVMNGTGALQESLYKELLGHIKQTDVQVPYREGGYWYYSRTEEGKQYPIYCRKAGSLDAPEQVTVDVNELAKREKFMAVGAMQVSDDAHLLAYSTDNTGFRQYKLHVKDLRTGALVEDVAEKVGSVAWAADNKTLFYTVEDSAKRHYRLYRHMLGSGKPDDLIYEEKDERFNVGVHRTRSRKYILLEIGSHTTSEMRFLAADQPTGEFKLINPRRQEHEYYVDDHGDQFLIRTNDKGRNFRLATAPIGDPGEKNWKELVPHRPAVMLSNIDVFQDFYVRVERENALPHLTIVDFKTGATHRIEFPEPVYSAFPNNNREYDTKLYRYSYQSMVTPSSVFDYDLEKRTSKLLKQVEVPGYDPAKYKSERLWATAKDGTRIPISIVYRKDFRKDGTHPLFLTGYGSYGISIPVTFSSNMLPLLDRGFAYAVAHIRGGGDMGKPWHDAGKMFNKKNTFTDFIDSAEYLIADKYTSKENLVVQGGSAGGLLMGAVTNMRPDLFRIVIAKVPFVDVVNTMLDASLPLTVAEYEEWGNPNKPDEYKYIRSYSPYDNLEKKAYPTILVKTSFNDSQVMYHEPAKYVARLRTLKTDSNPLVLKTNMAAGHGGSSGRYDYLKEIAFDYAFVLSQMGMEKPAAAQAGK
ncbi:MAG: S9 family peptidase [Acidobacteriia bacterium]|nr:S9 family peptidase [Terriglobia bacterium]